MPNVALLPVTAEDYFNVKPVWGLVSVKIQPRCDSYQNVISLSNFLIAGHNFNRLWPIQTAYLKRSSNVASGQAIKDGALFRMLCIAQKTGQKTLSDATNQCAIKTERLSTQIRYYI